MNTQKAKTRARLAAFSVVGLILTGCAGTIAGSGLTNRNETITALAVTDGGTNESFQLTADSGWTCNGTLTKQQARQLGGSITVPLDCDDGRTGTSTLTLRMSQGQIDGQFRLSDGTTGTVIFNSVL